MRKSGIGGDTLFFGLYFFIFFLPYYIHTPPDVPVEIRIEGGGEKDSGLSECENDFGWITVHIRFFLYEDSSVKLKSYLFKYYNFDKTPTCGALLQDIFKCIYIAKIQKLISWVGAKDRLLSTY